MHIWNQTITAKVYTEKMNLPRGQFHMEYFEVMILVVLELVLPSGAQSVKSHQFNPIPPNLMQ